jgi:hypothetical protein
VLRALERLGRRHPALAADVRFFAARVRHGADTRALDPPSFARGMLPILGPLFLHLPPAMVAPWMDVPPNLDRWGPDRWELAWLARHGARLPAALRASKDHRAADLRRRLAAQHVAVDAEPVTPSHDAALVARYASRDARADGEVDLALLRRALRVAVRTDVDQELRGQALNLVRASCIHPEEQLRLCARLAAGAEPVPACVVEHLALILKADLLPAASHLDEAAIADLWRLSSGPSAERTSLRAALVPIFRALTPWVDRQARLGVPESLHFHIRAVRANDNIWELDEVHDRAQVRALAAALVSKDLEAWLEAYKKLPDFLSASVFLDEIDLDPEVLARAAASEHWPDLRFQPWLTALAARPRAKKRARKA